MSGRGGPGGEERNSARRGEAGRGGVRAGAGRDRWGGQRLTWEWVEQPGHR